MISMQLSSVWLSTCGGPIRTFVEDAVAVIRQSEGAMQRQAMESLCSVVVARGLSAEIKMWLEVFAELSRDCPRESQLTAACCLGKLLVRFFEFVDDWGLIWDIVRVITEFVEAGEVDCLDCLADVARRIAGAGHQEYAQAAGDIISRLEADGAIVPAILMDEVVLSICDEE
jgi:hypothetical protein